MAQKCHGDQPAQSRLGVSFGAFRTRLVFAERGTIDLEEWAIGGSFERKLSKAVTLQLSGGGIGYARLGGPGERTLRGFFAGAGASWAVVDQKGAIPLVMLGVSLAASLAVPEAGGDDALYAIDVRGSVTAGYTLAQRWTPYVVGRLFGGPVVRVERGQSFTGTDSYHFQLGAGLVVGLPKGFDLSVELVPLGEQRISAGVGYSF